MYQIAICEDDAGTRGQIASLCREILARLDTECSVAEFEYAEELEKCESIFSQMLREQTMRSSGCRAMNEALFMELCILICRAFSRAERKSLSEISNLSRLLEFMKRHYMEELPLPELAVEQALPVLERPEEQVPQRRRS